jgi:hypothetical protein
MAIGAVLGRFAAAGKGIESMLAPALAALRCTASGAVSIFRATP